MKKLVHKARHALHNASHHKVARRGHHALPLVYYALAMLDDSGAKFWIVCGIFSLHALTIFTGDEL